MNEGKTKRFVKVKRRYVSAVRLPSNAFTLNSYFPFFVIPNGEAEPSDKKTICICVDAPRSKLTDERGRAAHTGSIDCRGEMVLKKTKRDMHIKHKKNK